MCSTVLNACHGDTGASVHESAIVVMTNMANTRKTVQVIRWSSEERRVVQACWTRATGEMIFPDPVSPKSPPNGEGQFFPHCHKKCQFSFTQEIQNNLNFAPKSVSNYQNQLVDAEKLFKKSHIFAWFHCSHPVLCGHLAIVLLEFPATCTLMYNKDKCSISQLRPAFESRQHTPALEDSIEKIRESASCCNAQHRQKELSTSCCWNILDVPLGKVYCFLALQWRITVRCFNN